MCREKTLKMKPASFYVAEEMRGRKLSDSEFAELQQIFQDEFHQVPQAVGMFLFSANRCRIANYLYPQCRPAKCQLWIPYAVGTKCPEVVLGARRESSANLNQQRTFPKSGHQARVSTQPASVQSCPGRTIPGGCWL